MKTTSKNYLLTVAIIASILTILSSGYLNSKSKSINFYNSWSKLAEIGEQIESFEVKITNPPGDHLGEIYGNTLTVFRKAKTKKIISIHYNAYPCQGDGYLSKKYYFDINGHLFFSTLDEGLYGNSCNTLYKNGKAVEKHTKAKDSITHTVQSVLKDSIKNMDIKNRISNVKKMIHTIRKKKNLFGTKNPKKLADFKKELEKFLNVLKKAQSSLEKKNYLNAFTWKRPKNAKEEPGTIIIGDNVRVRSSSNTKSKIITTVSYRHPNIKIIKIGRKKTIKPWGMHHWYKIKITYNAETGKTAEGWVFGAFIAPDSYRR